MGFVPESLRAKLIIGGKFKPMALKSELCRERGWSSVECHEWIPREDLGRLLAEARMGLVLFHAVPNHTEALPNKLFEYMAAGPPLIASDFALWRQIITDAGCGLLVDPDRPKAIADAIRWLLEHSDEAEHMGMRGREAVTRKYNWDVEAVKLLDLCRKLEG